MLPDPLHPAVVHFPVVFAVLLPLFAIGALFVIRKGARATRAWTLPLAMAGALALSSWAAVETGESQEDRVEPVVAEAAFEAHEEAAEAFLTASAILLLIAAAGLAPGLAGRSARVVTAAGAVVLLVMGARVGHSGGQLVYQHGAATAYTNTGATGERLAASGEVTRRGGDDDDR